MAVPRAMKADGGAASPAIEPPSEQVVPAPTGEWMTNTPASAYRAYRSKPAKTDDAPTWVQIDLGESHPIDFVKVYPANERMVPGRDEDYAGEGYPARFKIECSNDPDFQSPRVIVDHTDADYPNPKGNIEKYAAQGASGRYVRLTVTRLMNVRRGRLLPRPGENRRQLRRPRNRRAASRHGGLDLRKRRRRCPGDAPPAPGR